MMYAFEAALYTSDILVVKFILSSNSANELIKPASVTSSPGSFLTMFLVFSAKVVCLVAGYLTGEVLLVLKAPIRLFYAILMALATYAYLAMFIDAAGSPVFKFLLLALLLETKATKFLALLT